jgi:hypothetical protein
VTPQKEIKIETKTNTKQTHHKHTSERTKLHVLNESWKRKE